MYWYCDLRGAADYNDTNGASKNGSGCCLRDREDTEGGGYCIIQRKDDETEEFSTYQLVEAEFDDILTGSTYELPQNGVVL